MHAGGVVRTDLRTLKRHLVGIAVLAAITVVVGIFIERFIDSRENAAAIAAFRSAALASMLVWLIGSVIAVWLAARARATAAILAALSKMQSLMNTYIAAPLKTIDKYEQSAVKYQQEVMYPLAASNQAKS